MENFYIRKNAGNTISCVKEIPAFTKGIVIAVHGFSSSKESPTVSLLLEEFPKKELGVIGIDLPGHGTGESLKETLSISGALDSIEAAEKYAVSLYPDCPVYYFASSFGAYLTGIYISTREHRGRKAFFRSAAVNMPSLFIKDDPTETEKEQYRLLDEQGWFDTGLDGHKSVRITKRFMKELVETDLFKVFSPEKYGTHKIATRRRHSVLLKCLISLSPCSKARDILFQKMPPHRLRSRISQLRCSLDRTRRIITTG